jgi:hypothetical protein
MNDINTYYSTVDKKILINYCENNNLKELIKLSTHTDLYIFNKKQKTWHLKTKDKILHECSKIKKKEIKNASSMLSNLSKLNTLNEIDNVNEIYINLQNKLLNINKIVGHINNIDIPTTIITIQPSLLNIKDDVSSDSYIEYYSNS